MSKKTKTTKVMQATDLKGQMEEYGRELNDLKLLLLRRRLELRKITESGYEAPESLVQAIELYTKDVAEKEITFSCLKRDYKEVVSSVGYKAEVRFNKATSTVKGWFAKKPVAMQTT